jgi:hypothetical protein
MVFRIMTASPVYYKQNLKVSLPIPAEFKPFSKSMRHYFEDFIINSSRREMFSDVIFYIEYTTKRLESIEAWESCRGDSFLEKNISTIKVKHIFRRSLLDSLYIPVDDLVSKIHDIFKSQIQVMDSYDIKVHARMIGPKLTSFSSDVYRLRMSFFYSKMKVLLKQMHIPESKNDLDQDVICASLEATSPRWRPFDRRFHL